MRPIAEALRNEFSRFFAPAAAEVIHRPVANFLACHQRCIELRLQEFFRERATVFGYVDETVGFENLREASGPAR